MLIVKKKFKLITHVAFIGLLSACILALLSSAKHDAPLQPLLAITLIVGFMYLIAWRWTNGLVETLYHEIDDTRAALEHAHLELQEQFLEQTRKLKQSYTSYQELVESANSIILRWDTQGIIRFANTYAVNFFGFTADELLGASVLDTIVPQTESTGRDLVKMIQDIGKYPEKYLRNENENIKKDGTLVWISWNNKAVVDEKGNTIEILSIGNDITEKKIYEQQIHQLAHFDNLTGLPNRALLINRLEQAIADAHRYQRVIPIFYIDLDRFKPINDSLGHHNGDLLLQQLSQRLASCLRKTDTLARMGGDEFTVILEAEDDAEKAFLSARHVARHMLNVMSEPFNLNGHEIYISGSIGIVLFPQDGTQTTELLKNADTAMYQGKKQGKNCFLFYKKHMNSMAMERLKLEIDLRKALDDGSLEVHYQPSVNLTTRTIECVEALVRWNHPELGRISPEQFIPMAEETGLIVPLGDWIISQAVEQAAKWRSAGHQITMAVNLSLRQFEHKHLLDNIKAVIMQHGLPANTLGLEITESTIMQDTGHSLETLRQLNRMGIHLLIDDFGTGYSSLARLRDLPIHTLKIDKSFIQDISQHTANARIVDAIIAMAKSLNINVIAEGVETTKQLQYLVQRGCDCIQGFYISEAAPADEISELLGRALKESLPAPVASNM